jgi:hypothetical protein
LTLLCIDRYFTVISIPGTFVSKLPFGSIKSALIWSILIVSFFGLLNSYLLIFDRKTFYGIEHLKVNNVTINVTYEKYFSCYELSNGFKVYLIWQNIHLTLYVLLPFLIMLIFNLLLIEKTFCLINNNKMLRYNNGKVSSQHQKMKNLTISLLFITFAFIFLTLPAAISYGFFSSFFESTKVLQSILIILDYLSFFNHSSIFFNSFISNLKFRKIVLSIYRLKFLGKCLEKKKDF